MDYQTITLPSNVNDAFSGQTNTRSSLHHKDHTLFLQPGGTTSPGHYTLPIDYTPDSAAIASNDNRWHVICDLITSDLSPLPRPQGYL